MRLITRQADNLIRIRGKTFGTELLLTLEVYGRDELLVCNTQDSNVDKERNLQLSQWVTTKEISAPKGNTEKTQNETIIDGEWWILSAPEWGSANA